MWKERGIYSEMGTERGWFEDFSEFCRQICNKSKNIKCEMRSRRGVFT